MVDVQEIRDEELPHWRELIAVVQPDQTPSVEAYLDWRRQAEDMTWLIAAVDGREAGAGFALVGWHTPPGVGKGEAYVLPEFRGQGVGTAIFRELARWVSERGCIELEATVQENDAASLDWVERRGFREVGRNSILALDLTEIDEPEVKPPDGVEIVSWADRPELATGIYQVAREAYPDVPGEEEVDVGDYEEWLSRDMQGANDKPEGVFVALSDDEVVGYAKLALDSARPEVAHHDITGVKRAWRGRGIAGALKASEIAWAKRRGYRRLETFNEARNEPIRRLNERHGYRVEPGSVTVRAAILGPD